MDCSTLFVLSLSTLLIFNCGAYKTGAGENACSGDNFLVPGHTGTSPLSTGAPYNITLGATEYSSNDAVEVTLTGAEYFKGFLIVATNEIDNQPIGTFSVAPGAATPQNYVQNRCRSLVTLGMGLTHTEELSSDSVGTNSLQLIWNAPDQPSGNIVFSATFVKSFRVYYVRIRSVTMWERGSSIPTDSSINLVKPYTPSPILPITTDGCGEDKGCFMSVPCSVLDGCDYLVSWKKVDDDKIQFELMGANTGRNQYVALGIAPRQQMNDVSIITCQADSDGRSQVKHYYAKNYPGAVMVNGIGPASGESQSYLNPTKNILSCRFIYDNNVAKSNLEVFKDLTSAHYNLFIARGNVSNGAMMKHNRLPANSGRINLVDGSKIIEGAQVNYFIKAHAAIMILAWVLFGSIGVILARYYKPMWTNSKSCGQKVWFSYHRALMVVTMFLTLIGFVMILLHKQGLYILPASLPHKAHPILGLISIICVLLNPILAALRCKPDSKVRPLFNWLHWFFGTVAHIFAIVGMFLGMLFESVMIPYWLIYILMGWVLFHVLCEFILEIHQCCMYDKNRDRTEEFQQSSAEGYGKGPDPKYAGRGFKCGVLICYLIVTIILAVVMTVIVCIWTEQGATIFQQLN